MKFKINDLVYHRTLRHKGLFKGYDKWDKDTCYFVFITDNWQFGDYFIKLIKEYNYEYKSLIDYVFDYLPNREAFSIYNYNIRDLYDYANMQSGMSKNGKFNKYPRYLKTIHDITVKNYNAFKKEYPEEIFQKRINYNLAYESKKDNYCVVIPICTNDIKDEGVQMHNCVGSYVERVINGDTSIAFLRHYNKPKESLVTIEIRDNVLCQAFRAYNSPLTKEDKEFLIKYCKEKDIKYGLR